MSWSPTLGSVDGGAQRLGSVHREAGQGVRPHWANRVGPSRTDVGSVREPPSQRATGYMARAPGSVGGLLVRKSGEGSLEQPRRALGPNPGKPGTWPATAALQSDALTLSQGICRVLKAVNALVKRQLYEQA
jgi:hypothetical protein